MWLYGKYISKYAHFLSKKDRVSTNFPLLDDLIWSSYEVENERQRSVFHYIFQFVKKSSSDEVF